jgi:ribosome production factor 2
MVKELKQKKKTLNLKKGKVQVKSAQELGVAAKSLGIGQKTKTHKGRKILERKSAKLIENPKRSIILKGKKSSETLNQLMRELHQMRGSEMSQLLLKKTHDVLPFEDASIIERTSVKYDCSLFVVGSH